MIYWCTDADQFHIEYVILTKLSQMLDRTYCIPVMGSVRVFFKPSRTQPNRTDFTLKLPKTLSFCTEIRRKLPQRRNFSYIYMAISMAFQHL